jgi:cation:H+ antiporter
MSPPPTLTLRQRVRRRAAALLALLPSGAGGKAISIGAAEIWPFPAVVVAAFLIAWGAECAQFMVSQGMALAILAWLQAMPEFAVEAVIAWTRQVHYMTANFTGSLRLLVGLGWPLIFGVALAGARMRERRWLWRIHLDDEHGVEVVTLGLPILYFLVIYAKATLTLVDAVVLIAIYLVYLWALSRLPPRELESVQELERVPRAIMGLRRTPRLLAVGGVFLLGGVILYLSAHPFLDSMLHLAVSFGISQYLFIQWVAPFLSEFPEKLSAIYWARQRGRAPMALMNMVSANINQWTMLGAMIPIVYSFSLGAPAAVRFDANQQKEILLTVAQSMLGMLLLSNMSFHLLEAAGIFLLWGAQFAVPHLHEEVTAAYFAWSALELILMIGVRRRCAALAALMRLWHARTAASPRS